MFTITKEFHFSASHHLEGLPEGHKCARDHGHNYVVEVDVEGTALDDTGFVLDYYEVGLIGDYLDRNLDHQDLNEVYPFQPSAENLAKHLFDITCVLLKDKIDRKASGTRIAAVRVKETPKTCAEWRP